MTTVEIGRGKTGRRAYPLDEIGIVPSRRTRDPEEVSVAWQIDAYRFEMPLVASPMDSVVSPSFAARLGELGGLAVLDLEGLWTRFPDPEPILAEIAAVARAEGVFVDKAAALRLMRAQFDSAASGSHLASTLQDLMTGRPTEIAHLNGAIAARAAAHDIGAPLNTLITQLIQLLEATWPDRVNRLHPDTQ